MEASVDRPPVLDYSDAPAAARSLYERHGQRVLTFCLSRVRHVEDAQDAAQTTFMYALTALERGVVPRHELAWLLKIAENVCRTSRRTVGRRLAVISPAEMTEVEAAADSLTPEAHEQRHELREALELLPESQRRAVLLREWQGLSYAEISDELGISVSAVETLLFRARNAMASSLERLRSRLVDLGLTLAGVRAWLPGGPGRVAAGAAVVGLAATPVFVPHQGNGHAAPSPAVASAAAQPATLAPPVTRASATGAAPAVVSRSGRARRAAHRAAKPLAAAREARPAAAPAGATPPASPAAAAPAPAPAPARGSAAPSAPRPAAAPLPVSAPLPRATEPVTAPLAPVVSTVVTTVQTATGAVPASPPLPPLPKLPKLP